MNLRALFSSNWQRGISYLELLLSVALLIVLSLGALPFAARFLLVSHTTTTTDQVISFLQKAKSYAQAGKGTGSWGVCLTGNQLRLFSGSCAAPTQQENYVIPATVTVSNLPTLLFSAPRGEPNQAATITISSTIKNTTIVVNRGGGISVQ